ncbi:MAG TPA: ammonia-forming cytochrome c nitrite reductase subunit c552 [Symbiobacteriaceae bacterium]|nr:ammonia-forming cytochrome c nitrite reductase subunit c552 [Symbiobacteriaceae bacterium]
MKKSLKIAMLLGLIIAALFAAGIVNGAKKEVPQYVGSQACLGCHADRWSSWAGSHHAGMVTPIENPSDIPGYDKATEEQKAELRKADYVISGGRFVAKDHETGKLVFLKFEWNHEENHWMDYDDAGVVWQDRCMGCHVTNAGKSGVGNEPTEFGIGCEACHGPGKDHLASKGDPSKITLNVSSDVCGQCHSSGYTMKDGTRWPAGYRPANKLMELEGLVPKAVDPNATANLGHHKTYGEWLVSGHGPKAVLAPGASGHGTDECYACHTQEAVDAKAHNEEFKFDANKNYASISCVTCHRPHGLGKAMDEKTMCATCHNGSLAEGTTVKPGSTPHHPTKEFFQGWGAAGGITSKGNVHEEVTCQECHMANNNHLMQVVKPNDPKLAEGSNDACTVCHNDSDREVRGAYLEMWQEFTTTKMEALKKDIAAIEAAVKAGATLTEAQKLAFDTAKTNVLFVEADGSMGAHNFDYATKIFSAAQKDLAAVKAAVVK